MNQGFDICLVGGEDVSARIPMAKLLIQAGLSVCIAGSQDKDIFDKANICYFKYPLIRQLGVIAEIKTLIFLRKLFLRIKPKIIQTFDTKPGLLVPISILGLREICVVRTITGMGRVFSEDNYKKTFSQLIYNFLQRMAQLHSNITVFQNLDDRKHFLDKKILRFFSTRLIKSSGIEIEKFKSKLIVSSEKKDRLKKKLGLSLNANIVTMVSRLVKQKGVKFFLQTARLCRNNGLPVEFLLVGPLDAGGDAVSISEIEKFSEVKYLGQRNDVAKILSISDIFVLPTFYREGIPRVLLEAAVAECALIATDMPGCRDFIENEKNGFLVAVKSSEEIFEAVKKLCVCTEAAKKLRISNLKTIKKYDLKKIAGEYLQIYTSLLGKNK
jgi:glycosyltransferase involved in cell wall biosynthesis